MKKIKKIGLLAPVIAIVVATSSIAFSLTAFNKPTQNTIKAANLPAFPGAAGFGSNTPGGRGGKILLVTNLEDYSTNQKEILGSLRAAISAKGSRIVIFKIGGLIKLKAPLIIAEPFLTIAGQTAPGDGIALRNAPLIVATHDVIIRNIRSRVGDDQKGSDPGNRDGISVSGTKSKSSVYNVIVDHSSISWGLDENLSTWTNKVHDVTFQWNIISDALRCNIHRETYSECHSMGLLIGDYAKNISIHHNFLAHNSDRNPLIQADTSTEFVNNIVYNWGGGSYPIKFSDSNKKRLPAKGTVISNIFKRGENSTSRSRVGVLFRDNLVTGTKIYVKNNLFLNQDGSRIGEDIILGKSSFRTTNPPIASGLNVVNIAINPDLILNQVGAITPKRDPIDQDAVNSYKKGDGKIIDCVISCDGKDIRSRFAGWPTYTTGTPKKDSDSDGMPDDWERSKNLNPNSAVDANKYSTSGYTWIEEYINSLIPISL